MIPHRSWADPPASLHMDTITMDIFSKTICPLMLYSGRCGSVSDALLLLLLLLQDSLFVWFSSLWTKQRKKGVDCPSFHSAINEVCTNAEYFSATMSIYRLATPPSVPSSTLTSGSAPPPTLRSWAVNKSIVILIIRYHQQDGYFTSMASINLGSISSVLFSRRWPCGMPIHQPTLKLLLPSIHSILRYFEFEPSELGRIFISLFAPEAVLEFYWTTRTNPPESHFRFQLYPCAPRDA